MIKKKILVNNLKIFLNNIIEILLLHVNVDFKLLFFCIDYELKKFKAYQNFDQINGFFKSPNDFQGFYGQ